ncbi:MAG TPA: hypothetical protein VGE07_03065 [Herpetosiphonaceae bacterium]
MVSLLRAIGRGMLGRCPVCGRGRLFASFFGLRDACGSCATRFTGGSNQSAGAMILNVFVTIALGFAGAIVAVLSFPQSLGLALAALFGGLALFHILFYRVAFGIWMGILARTGALDENQDAA